MELLPKALLITAIGMGLVFAAIVLLWGLMALLVRLIKDPEPRLPEDAGDEEILETVEVSDGINVRAAAVAVATALAISRQSSQHWPPPYSDNTENPWKSAHRAIKITRNARVYNRRKRFN